MKVDIKTNLSKNRSKIIYLFLKMMEYFSNSLKINLRSK